MSRNLDRWCAWDERWQTEAGLESPFDHNLIEVKTRASGRTHAVNPVALLGPFDSKSLFWRPMIWAREGIGVRRPYEAVAPEAILEGLDGFLFLRIQSAFEQIFEGIGLSDIGANRWAQAFETRFEWCRGRGIEFRFLVVPETEAVYNDKVPGQPAASPQRPIRRILQQPNKSIQTAVVYPHDDLVRGRARFETYNRDDVHFTSYGAYLCYRALMLSLPQVTEADLIPETALEIREVRNLGGLARMLNREIGTIRRMSPPKIQTRSLVKDARFAPGKVQVFETERSSAPCMVVFRTSNTSAMFPYLFHHFSRVVAVSGLWFLDDLIESEQPQIVVLEICERHLAPNAAAKWYDPDKPRELPHGEFHRVTGFELPLPRGTAGSLHA